MKNSYIQKIRSIKGFPILAGLFLIGALLLFFSSSFDNSEVKKEAVFDTAEYTKELEDRLTSLISSIEGVGNVSVVITLDSGSISAFLYDESERINSGGTETEKKAVLTDNGNKGNPISTYEEMPKIRGVGIVCSGGGNDVIRKKVTDLAYSLTGVSKNRIFVTN